MFRYDGVLPSSKVVIARVFQQPRGDLPRGVIAILAQETNDQVIFLAAIGDQPATLRGTLLAGSRCGLDIQGRSWYT